MSAGLGQRFTQEEFDVLDEEPRVKAPAFSIPTIFQDTVTVTMNLEMRDQLCNLLGDIEGTLEKELYALKRALIDPEGCRARRFSQRR